jgi:hypothetical protein
MIDMAFCARTMARLDGAPPSAKEKEETVEVWLEIEDVALGQVAVEDALTTLSLPSGSPTK